MQTSSVPITPPENIQELGVDLVVAYNQTFSQFKENITRKDVEEEFKKFSSFGCVNVTKQFQLAFVAENQWIYTDD